MRAKSPGKDNNWGYCKFFGKYVAALYIVGKPQLRPRISVSEYTELGGETRHGQYLTVNKAERLAGEIMKAVEDLKSKGEVKREHSRAGNDWIYDVPDVSRKREYPKKFGKCVIAFHNHSSPKYPKPMISFYPLGIDRDVRFGGVMGISVAEHIAENIMKAVNDLKLREGIK